MFLDLIYFGSSGKLSIYLSGQKVESLASFPGGLVLCRREMGARTPEIRALRF